MGLFEIIVGLVLICMIFVFIVTRGNGMVKNSRMSFQESIDLIDIPIVTFWNKGKKFNFLLDTGANFSIINKKVLKDFKYTLIEEEVTETIGANGPVVNIGNCVATLRYNGLSFDEKFRITDLSVALDSIKKTNGVTIHGILGSSFFVRNQYVLDFEKMIAYIKKSNGNNY